MTTKAKKFFGGTGVKDAMKIFSDGDERVEETMVSEKVHNTHNTPYQSYDDNKVNTSNMDNMKAKRRGGKESKSRRFSLLLRPSILVALNKIARMENNSPTDIINTVLEKYIETQGEVIAKYETLFDESGRPKI